jgi:hypothetical protein
MRRVFDLGVEGNVRDSVPVTTRYHVYREKATRVYEFEISFAQARVHRSIEASKFCAVAVQANMHSCNAALHGVSRSGVRHADRRAVCGNENRCASDDGSVDCFVRHERGVIVPLSHRLDERAMFRRQVVFLD